MYSLQYWPQMDHTQYPENGERRRSRLPLFLHIYYGPSVACTVGCTWLMYNLCMAHIWPMYDLHMAHILAIYMAMSDHFSEVATKTWVENLF